MAVKLLARMLPLLLLPLHLRMMSPYIMLPLLSMLVVLEKLLLYLLLLDLLGKHLAMDLELDPEM